MPCAIADGQFCLVLPFAVLPIPRDRGFVAGAEDMRERTQMAGPKLAGYKLATYRSSEGPRAGLVSGTEVFDAAKLTGKSAYATVMGILADWKAAEGALKKA